MSLTTTVAVMADRDPEELFRTMVAVVCEATDGRNPETVVINGQETGLMQGLLALVGWTDTSVEDAPPGTTALIELTTYGWIASRPCKGVMHARLVELFVQRTGLERECMIESESLSGWVTPPDVNLIATCWHGDKCGETCAPAVSTLPFRALT